MQRFEFGMIFALSFMSLKIILHLKMNTLRIYFALWTKITLRGRRSSTQKRCTLGSNAKLKYLETFFSCFYYLNIIE